MTEKKPISGLKQAGLQIISGGSAGLVEVSIMHPLDVVKTRLQLQAKGVLSEANYYKGIIDCFAKMYRKEGVFSYWKGIIPPIMAESPKRATKFLCFEQYKRFFMFGNDKPIPLTYSLSGLCAGVTEAFVVNPFEVVKVNMQASTTTNPPTWTVTKEIIKRDGFGSRGLGKGITATIARNGSFNMVYFGFYHSFKDLLPSYENPQMEFLRKVGLGLIAGSMGTITNTPFDVAKSRIQGPQPVAGEIKYKGTVRTLVMVAREEGFFALYKGFLPKVLRLGPGGAIMLLVFEYTYNYLETKFS